MPPHPPHRELSLTRGAGLQQTSVADGAENTNIKNADCRQLPQEDSQMANKCILTSPLLAIREMPPRTPGDGEKQTNSDESQRGQEETRIHPRCRQEPNTGRPRRQTARRIPQELNLGSPCCPAILLLGRHPRELKTRPYKIPYVNVHGSGIRHKGANNPNARPWGRGYTNAAHPCAGILLGHRKERPSDTCYNVDEPEDVRGTRLGRRRWALARPHPSPARGRESLPCSLPKPGQGSRAWTVPPPLHVHGAAVTASVLHPLPHAGGAHVTQSGRSEPFRIIPTCVLVRMLSPSLWIENYKDYVSTDLLVFPAPCREPAGKGHEHTEGSRAKREKALTSSEPLDPAMPDGSPQNNNQPSPSRLELI